MDVVIVEHDLCQKFLTMTQIQWRAIQYSIPDLLKIDTRIIVSRKDRFMSFSSPQISPQDGDLPTTQFDSASPIYLKSTLIPKQLKKNFFFQILNGKASLYPLTLRGQKS